VGEGGGTYRHPCHCPACQCHCYGSGGGDSGGGGGDGGGALRAFAVAVVPLVTVEVVTAVVVVVVVVTVGVGVGADSVSSRVMTFVCFPQTPRDAGIIYFLNNHYPLCPVSSAGYCVVILLPIGSELPKGSGFDSRSDHLFSFMISFY